MEPKVLSITSNQVRLDVKIRPATVGDGMRKSMLEEMAKAVQIEDPGDKVSAVKVFPRCIACSEGTVSYFPSPDEDKEALVINIVDLTPQAFVALPYEIGERWLNDVLVVNPAFNIKIDTSPEASKNA